MSDDRLRKALRALADEIENATARCKDKVESVASGPADEIEDLTGLIDDIFEDSEQAPKLGFLIVSAEALKALRSALSDVSAGEVESPFADLAWEMRKALREFQQAAIRETAKLSQ